MEEISKQEQLRQQQLSEQLKEALQAQRSKFCLYVKCWNEMYSRVKVQDEEISSQISAASDLLKKLGESANEISAAQVDLVTERKRTFINLSNISEEWKKIFKDAGISKKDLRDSETARVLLETLERAGINTSSLTGESFSSIGDEGGDDGASPAPPPRGGAPPPPPRVQPPSLSPTSMAPTAAGGGINITSDVKMLQRTPEVPKLPQDKKVRMKKWFDMSPFKGLLDYSDQRNIELQCPTGPEGDISLKMIRCGVKMNHELAKLVLNKARMGCSRDDAVYMCFESEVKKLNKNACKRWLACINSKSYQEKLSYSISSAASLLSSARTDEEIFQALQDAILADTQPAAKRQALSSAVIAREVNETYVPFALITENSACSILMTTDLETLNSLIFKPSDEVIRYIRAQDEWHSIVGSKPYVNLNNFEAQTKLLGPDLEKEMKLSESIRQYIAPHGVLYRSEWCALYARCGPDVNKHFDSLPPEEKANVLLWGKRGFNSDSTSTIIDTSISRIQVTPSDSMRSNIDSFFEL